jgi:hypothetical protein
MPLTDLTKGGTYLCVGTAETDHKWQPPTRSSLPVLSHQTCLRLPRLRQFSPLSLAESVESKSGNLPDEVGTIGRTLDQGIRDRLFHTYLPNHDAGIG